MSVEEITEEITVTRHEDEAISIKQCEMKTEKSVKLIYLRIWQAATLVATIVALAFLIWAIVVTATRPEKEIHDDIDQRDFAQGAKWADATLYNTAAVVTDNRLCSVIAREVLQNNGNAVDAAVAAAFCLGVTNPQSSGLGGGFFMALFNSTTRQCSSLNAREMAPLTAKMDMFLNAPENSTFGYQSVAVPGEMHGLWTGFKRFSSGNIPWYDLIRPSIQLAREGFTCSFHLDSVLKEDNLQRKGADILRKVYTNANTSRFYQEGEIIRNAKLADTLEKIAGSEDPSKLFYQDEIAKTISAEFLNEGGIIQLGDLSSYKTLVQPALTSQLEDLTFCGPPPPSSFVVTQAIPRVMAEIYKNERKLQKVDGNFFHRLIETMKFAFGQRFGLADVGILPDVLRIVEGLIGSEYPIVVANEIPKKARKNTTFYSPGIPRYAVDDHGTNQISIIDSDGNAVSLTSSINTNFGSMMMSDSLGIVWNNQMDNFAVPGQRSASGFSPSPVNFIAPGKRPMSSSSPTIIIDNNTSKVRIVAGGAGGPEAISSMANVLSRAIVLGYSAGEAVNSPRVHNQLLPLSSLVEEDFDLKTRRELEKKHGQEVREAFSPIGRVHMIMQDADGTIQAVADERTRNGAASDGY